MFGRKASLVDWLQDAHALEQAAIQILQTQLLRLGRHPEIKDKVQEHLEQSRSQADRIESCLRQLGREPSFIKQGVARVTALGNVLPQALASDEIVKNLVSDYAFEQLEIASYTVLIAAAERANEPAVKQVCADILAEEEAMAAWLRERLPQIARDYMGPSPGTGA